MNECVPVFSAQTSDFVALVQQQKLSQECVVRHKSVRPSKFIDIISQLADDEALKSEEEAKQAIMDAEAEKINDEYEASYWQEQERRELEELIKADIEAGFGFDEDALDEKYLEDLCYPRF